MATPPWEVIAGAAGALACGIVAAWKWTRPAPPPPAPVAAASPLGERLARIEGELVGLRHSLDTLERQHSELRSHVLQVLALLQKGRD